jgi:hypothetical protein
VTTSAKVIADSLSPEGVRLTTLEVVMHRFVLAEFNTHRVFTRSSASSRAIPVEKQIDKVLHNPAWPLVWAGEQPGMQGAPDLEGDDLLEAQQLFASVHRNTVLEVEQYLAHHPEKSTRVHKSLINRLLEPFMWHTVVVTATEWDNFYGLRCHYMAQPEIRVAAELMRDAMAESTPTPLNYGEWHTPYIRQEDIEQDDDAVARGEETPYFLPKVSAARCARTSYLTQDGIRDPGADLGLFQRLAGQQPPHSAPLEHVATPFRVTRGMDGPHLGNFRGWTQLRHLVENGKVPV